jgi:hypothetical protein
MASSAMAALDSKKAGLMAASQQVSVHMLGELCH